jgi:hypothetical protein
MSFFGSIGDALFGDPKAGQNAANPYMEEAMAELRKYMQPYVDIGMGVAPGLQEEYMKLMSDPAAMLEYFMSGYEPSKEYQYKQEQMGQAAANSAAAGGMRGSPLDQYNQQDITNSLLNADMQKYLGNVGGLYTQGLTGNQGLFNTGYNAANSLSSDLANILNSQGGLAYNSAIGKNKNQSALWGFGAGLGSAFF